MTDFEKNIYNQYLQTYRTKQNKPFKHRKNFENFESSEYYPQIIKLSNFFQKFKHININDFFDAPYNVYPDEDFNLNFYTKQSAIKVYTIYMNKCQNEPPDCDQQREFIRKSLKFLYDFCKENNIIIDEYLTHKTNLINTFLMHLKEHNISIYVLFGFPNFDKEFATIDNDIKEFILGKLANKINLYRTRFYTSQKAKHMIKQGILILKRSLYKKPVDNPS